MENRPFRLITSGPLEALATTIEAVLVVASAPLSVADLALVADDDEARIESALELLAERFREGRSGIVLEHVAGGYAFRASREAALSVHGESRFGLLIRPAKVAHSLSERSRARLPK